VEYKDLLISNETSKNTQNKTDNSLKTSQPNFQLTLPNFNDKQTEWDINNQNVKEIHYAIGKMISLDIQPFSVVEDHGFKQLLKNCSQSTKFLVENILLIQLYLICVLKFMNNY
jgi:hypothetical protein